MEKEGERERRGRGDMRKVKREEMREIKMIKSTN